MTPTANSLFRRLAPVCLASLGWAFSFGLGSPLSSLLLQQEGLSAWVVGLNTSVYYLGVALAAPLVPRFMIRHGRGCVIFGMLLDAITTAVFPLVQGALFWHLLRFIGGVGTAFSLIPMETLVNQNAPSNRRAGDFGIYAFFVALGIGLGSTVGIPLYPLAPEWTFALGGFVTLIALLPVWLFKQIPVPIGEDSAPQSPLPWQAGFLGLGTAWVQGFLEGGTLAFLSLYLLGLHYSEGAVSLLMGGLFGGVVLAQLPLAWCADRIGRLPILLFCHALVLCGMILVPTLVWTGFLALWLFLLGAACGALYPLGLALLGERVPRAAIAQANAWYLSCNCFGSLSGPLLIGLAIDLFGMKAQFAMGAGAVSLVVITWLLFGSRSHHSAMKEKPAEVTSHAA